MSRILFILFITLASFTFSNGQEAQYKAVSVGFYNLENLFHPSRDTTIRDEEFTPYGKRAWTEERYAEKLANMAYVISQMATDITPAGVSILGVSEIENKKVLEDLVSQKSLESRNYQIIHFDSPDRRGIDVGLLYNPSHFEPLHSEKLFVPLYEAEDTIWTRDILHVKGILDGDTTDIYVNHWPSRRGGEKRSAPKRMKAASIVKAHIDSLRLINPNVKAIVMGDLNDDPTSPSVKGILRAEGKKNNVDDGEMYNPMHNYYIRGIGSNAYRDNWSLFDQIIITPSLISGEENGYQFYKAHIFNKKYLIQRSGKYKGYPFRTFSFDKYQAGFSDHFPVIVYLVKKV